MPVAAFTMRKFVVKLILVLVTLSVFIHFQIFGDVIKKNFIDQISIVFHKEGNSNDCRIPYYEPFDSVVLPFMQEESPIECGTPQLALTFVINDTIHINVTAVNELQTTHLDLKAVMCTYYNIDRAFNGSEISDDGVVFNNARVFYLLIFIS